MSVREPVNGYLFPDEKQMPILTPFEVLTMTDEEAKAWGWDEESSDQK